MAAVRAGFHLDHLGEYAADADLAQRCPRAEKYIGWPMLVTLRLVPSPGRSYAVRSRSPKRPVGRKTRRTMSSTKP
jgi:hypothetical protein